MKIQESVVFPRPQCDFMVKALWGSYGGRLGCSGVPMGVDWGALGVLWESIGVLWGPYGGRLGCSGVIWGPCGG